MDKKFRWGKWLVLIVVLAAVTGGGYWYYKYQKETPAEYQTSTATRGDLTQVVTATGQIGPVVNVQVGSQVSGIIRKILVDYNSVVKSNQIIAEIDPSAFQVNVQKAEADLANAKANLALAQVQAHRADSLYTNNLISASDHDTALAQLQQAQAMVQSDEATLQNAKVQLSYCTIYAPVDGVVISRNVDVGQTVASSFNTPTLFQIANDLTKMEIDALVSEADVGGVAVGQDVNFTVDAYPYRTFRGKLNQIRYGAITNQNVINYDCVIGVNNSDLKLFPGMTANVSIIVAERDNVLKIPNAALRFRPPEALAAESRTNELALRAMAQQRSGGEGGLRARGNREGGGEATAANRAGPGLGVARNGQPGAARRAQKPEHQLTRTIYVLPKVESKDAPPPKPKPVTIKIGISDGISTEVLDGLSEGEQVVTAIISDSTSSRPASNPFGGGFRRF